jgi:hypothetical protein
VDKNVNCKAEENTGENVNNLHSSNAFYDATPKAELIKEITDKLTSLQRNFLFRKRHYLAKKK